MMNWRIGIIMNIPNRKGCIRLLIENNVPKNIIDHSMAVCDVALELGENLKKRGEMIDLELLQAGALLHDIKKHETFDKGYMIEASHGRLGEEFLTSIGLSEVGFLSGTHIPTDLIQSKLNDKWENLIVCYADMRINHNKRVSLNNRYSYLLERYPGGKKSLIESRPFIENIEQRIKEKLGEEFR